jgi:uncharacterized damage-inducible protein DinB
VSMHAAPRCAKVGTVKANEVLLDAFGRLPQLVDGAVRDLTKGQLSWAPEPGANTIAWLVWHLTRIQDDHVGDLMGVEQIWTAGRWAERFGLSRDSMETGYGHSPDEVAQLRPSDAQALTDYYSAVHQRTAAYVDTLTDADLDRVVDERWTPPVTVGVRLVSVVNDDAQHAGQAAYIRGLLPR